MSSTSTGIAEATGPRASAATQRVRRVAAVIAANEVTGPGRQLVALGAELARRGIEMCIVLLNRPGAPRTFADFARASGIECRVMADRGPLDAALAAELGGFIDAWRPDVVETHGYKPTSLMWWLRRRGLALPWVGFFEGQTDLGPKDRLYHRLDLRMLRSADRVVVMSETQRAMFPARADNVSVVANAVPGLARAADRSQLPAVLRGRRGEGAVPLAGAIGRLSREKGVDVLLEAFAQLKARGVAVHGVVIGAGPLEAELQAQARQLGIDETVTFTGAIEMVREVYEALDLMVIPSRSEGLPSVLLEALPTGLPVVSTRVGAMIEMAKTEPEALRIVAPEAPDALADAIADALLTAGDQRAAAARARLAATYSVERRAEAMIGIFGQSIAARGAP